MARCWQKAAGWESNLTRCLPTGCIGCISENAIQTAGRLVQVLEEAGFSFYLKSPTNQQFVILENRQMERLAKKVAFSFWETLDEDHTAVRFVTSWATDPQNLEALWEILAQEAGQKA